MGRAGSGAEFHINFRSVGLGHGSLHLWVGLVRVKKNGPTFNSGWRATTKALSSINPLTYKWLPIPILLSFLSFFLYDVALSYPSYKPWMALNSFLCWCAVKKLHTHSLTMWHVPPSRTSAEARLTGWPNARPQGWDKCSVARHHQAYPTVCVKCRCCATSISLLRERGVFKG